MQANYTCPGIVERAFEEWWAETDAELGCTTAVDTDENAASPISSPGIALIAAAAAAAKMLADLF